MRHAGSHKTKEEASYATFLCGIIPLSMKAGMPAWFENKMFKKQQSYMPSSFGGLGIPSNNNWTLNEKCFSIFKAHCLEHYENLLLPRKLQDSTWHRGIEFKSQISDISELVGGIRFHEAWSKTQSKIDEGSETPSGSRRVQREIYKEYIRIDEPCDLLGTKEAAAPAVYSGRFNDKIVKPNMRSRQILSKKAQLYKCNRELVDSIPWTQIEVNDLHLKRPGIWAPRKDVLELLGIGFSAPSMHFSSRFLSGTGQNFALDRISATLNEGFADDIDHLWIDNLDALSDIRNNEEELYEL
jgi:hypothetical protein